MRVDDVEQPLGGKVVISKRFRRRAVTAPGFESLESRSLLSRFSGPMAPSTEGSRAAEISPPATIVMRSTSSPVPCGRPSASTPQASSSPRSGRPRSDDMRAPITPPPASRAVLFEQAGTPAGQPGGGVPGSTSSGGSGAGQSAGLRGSAGGQAAIARAIARPSEPPVGLGPPHPGRAPGIADIEIAVAPGLDPAASSLPPPGSVENSVANAPTAIASGSPRLAYSQLGFTALIVAIVPEWTLQTDAPRQDDHAGASAPLGAGIASAHEPAANVTAKLPAPQGAGLITDLAAFTERQLDDCLTRLFDRSAWSNESSDQLARAYPYLVEVALAVFAVELARRWHQRSAQTPRPSRRSRFFLLNSLL
jgi:hypothetical protein